MPQLAETIDVSDVGKRYVFTLRRGVLFHDGTEMTAADVKRSMERSLAPKTPCPVPSYYERISGYKAYHSGKAPELSGVKRGREVRGERPAHRAGRDVSPRNGAAHNVAAVQERRQELGSTLLEPRLRHGPLQGGALRQRPGDPPLAPRRLLAEGQALPGRASNGIWACNRSPSASSSSRATSTTCASSPKRTRSCIARVLRGAAAANGDPGMNSNGAFMNTRMPPFDNRHFRRAVAFAINRKQVATVRPGHVQAHGKVVPNTLIPMTPGLPSRALRLPTRARGNEARRLSLRPENGQRRLSRTRSRTWRSSTPTPARRARSTSSSSRASASTSAFSWWAGPTYLAGADASKLCPSVGHGLASRLPGSEHVLRAHPDDAGDSGRREPKLRLLLQRRVRSRSDRQARRSTDQAERMRSVSARRSASWPTRLLGPPCIPIATSSCGSPTSTATARIRC